jgi:hypothetical protein
MRRDRQTQTGDAINSVAGIIRNVIHFSFSKTPQFPSKSAKSGIATLNPIANIVNVYGSISNFQEFFPADPLPTPVF